jgi:hypothetical protein
VAKPGQDVGDTLEVVEFMAALAEKDRQTFNLTLSFMTFVVAFYKGRDLRSLN